MKPLSSHWADQAAFRIVRQLGEKDLYTVASGITPSGVVHIGNFREAFTVDLVARALKDLGKNVRFVYSWDDFDTFRKVPGNVPDPQALEPSLRKSISVVPDPWGVEDSYARANEVRFENEIKKVGIFPEFLYQSKKYESCEYAELVQHALKNKDKISAILNEHRSTPLASDWLPTAIFCESCGKDEMHSESFDGEWTYSYHCKSCDHNADVNLKEAKTLKLNWRTDWPMRWVYESVDFEPGGKDHSSEGGSYDTGKEIVKQLWDKEPPIYLQYDFVTIKGVDGKMSSSKGNLLTLSQAFDVYSPQMVRWIFAAQRANHDFAIAFDEDVIRTHDEFDRAEASVFNPDADKTSKKWLQAKRIYDFSLVNHGELPGQAMVRPSFRILCNYLQICDGDIERVYDRFYSDQFPKDSLDYEAYVDRAKRAWTWIETLAPESFKYRLRDTRVEGLETPDNVKAALTCLTELFNSVSLEDIDSKELNEKIYADVIHASEAEPTEFFKAVYQRLIGRDQGPRLPTFLKEVGKERLLSLL